MSEGRPREDDVTLSKRGRIKGTEDGTGMKREDERRGGRHKVGQGKGDGREGQRGREERLPVGADHHVVGRLVPQSVLRPEHRG